MNPEQIKNILLAIVGSLASFLFYGYIETKDMLDKVDTRLQQAESELNDLWGKYNKEQDEKMNFIREFYKELDKKKDK
jgi:hypothetical protein